MDALAIADEPMISRSRLMKDYALSEDQLGRWEEMGLPVYGIGHKRFYDPAEIRKFIKEHRLERAKRG